jgi:YD repeat-containing protein
MKSLIYSLSLFTVILLANCSQDQASPLSADFKKKIHTEEKWYQPGDMMDTLLFGFRVEYNKDGNPVDKKSFSRADGSLQLHTTYKYDEHGNAIEEIITQPEANIITKILKEYQYDNSGKKIKMLETNVRKNTLSEHLYTYHNDGSYDEVIRIQSKDDSFKSYNADGEVTSIKNYSNNSITTTDYDKQGNLLKRVSTYSGKVLNEKSYINEYNDTNQLIAVTLENRKRTYEYNENGDVVKETWYKNGTLDRVINYKYTYFE